MAGLRQFDLNFAGLNFVLGKPGETG